MPMNIYPPVVISNENNQQDSSIADKQLESTHRKMFWDKSVPLTEKMYEAAKPSIYFTRFFGIFPLSVSKKQSQLCFKLSPLFTLYSFILGAVVVITTYSGLLDDTFAEKQKSVRIRSTTELYVVSCDVTLVLLVVFYGIFVQTFAVFKYFKFIRCLLEVDLIIPLQNVKPVRNASILMMVVIFIVSVFMLVSDQLIYLKNESDRISRSAIIARYLSFYIAYIIMMVTQYKFTYNAYGILRRLRGLNKHLEANLKRGTSEEVLQDKSGFRSPSEISLLNNQIGYIIDTLSNKNQQIPKTFTKIKAKISNQAIVPQNFNFLKLASAFIHLCDAVDFLNQLMGATNAITIVGILWHLIESPFHALSELAGSRKDVNSVLINAGWCVFHLGRLSMLVEPCNSCTYEVQKMQNFVCKLLCSNVVSDDQKYELEIFATTLLQGKLEFSAGGLSAINRSLVTGILGTITTYLVILLQYQSK